jgi:hypothetical protein
MMKRANVYICFGVAVCFLSLTSWAAATQKPPSCSDIPIRVTVYNSVGDPITGISTALRSDGGGEYSGTIHICDGTDDAIVNVSATKRTFLYRFPDAILGSVNKFKPTWVPGDYYVSGWINVRNLLYRHSSFTTHMGTTFKGPDGSSYRLAFMPETVDAVDLHTVNDNQNIPFTSSPVRIDPQPYDWNSGTKTCTIKPSWLVMGNNPSGDSGTMQVGTLYKLATSPKNSNTHAGQYSMPFEFRIESLVCFDYPGQ